MKTIYLSILGVVIALSLSACSGQPLTTREKGTLGGGVLGAGAGAIVGAAVGHPGAGAAIGGGLGAVTGAVVGNEFQNHEAVEARQQSQISSQQRQINHQRSEIEQLRGQSETE